MKIGSFIPSQTKSRLEELEVEAKEGIKWALSYVFNWLCYLYVSRGLVWSLWFGRILSTSRTFF